MDAPDITSTQVPTDLRPLAAMGLLLERLERLPRSATAAQYRDVVTKIQELLRQATPGIALDALLAALPATAEVYENLQYAHAGLCRSHLDSALKAELAVKGLLEKY